MKKTFIAIGVAALAGVIYIAWVVAEVCGGHHNPLC